MPANLDNSAAATGLERSVFIPILKKDNAKDCSNYHRIALISHAGKIRLKILQGKLQQYVNRELPVVHAGFRNQIANICWITGKVRQFQKIIYFCFIDYTKAFDCGSQQTVENCERDGNTRSPYLPPEKSRSNS